MRERVWTWSADTLCFGSPAQLLLGNATEFDPPRIRCQNHLRVCVSVSRLLHLHISTCSYRLHRCSAGAGRRRYGKAAEPTSKGDIV